MVSLTGSDGLKITEVTLYDSSGPTEVNGSLQVCQMSLFTIYTLKRAFNWTSMETLQTTMD